MARRGENIHKRKDGRWEGRYIKARTPDRRICWGYIYGTTYAEVKQRLIHKKSEYGGFQLIDAHLTFTELAEAWLWFADFKVDPSKRLKLLFCIDMLNEGVHVEGISGVILFRPTISPIMELIMQRAIEKIRKDMRT